MIKARKSRPKPSKFPGSMEVERYLYTPGIHGLRFSEAIINGKIVGMECSDGIYVPPLTYCPDHREGRIVELSHDIEWVVETFTVVYEDLNGNRLDKPRVIALLRPVCCKGGLIHYVEADPREVRVGMRVRPVLKPVNERTGSITDIMFFKPI